MKTARWLIATPFLVISTVLLIVLSLAAHVALLATDNDTPKRWLEKSNVYEQLPEIGVDLALAHLEESVRKENPDITRDELLGSMFTEAELTQEMRTVFEPEWTKRTVEATIDSIYAFAKGETEELVISLALRDRKEAIQKAIGNLFKARLAALPVCPHAGGDYENFNLVRAECLPSNLSKTEGFRVIDEQVKKIPVPDTQTVTVPPDAKEHIAPISRAIRFVPQAIGLAVIVLALLYLLVFFLMPGPAGRWKGLRAVWTVAGSVLLLLSLGLFFGMVPLSIYIELLNAPALEPVLERLAGAAANDIALRLGLTAAALFLLAYFAGTRAARNTPPPQTLS